MTAIVTTDTDLHHEAGEFTVTIRKPVLVAVGEYTDQGEPDVLIHVVHAIDDDGNDMREFIGRAIAKALDELDGDNS